MIDYKKTLNLFNADFPMKANLPTKEPGMLKWWTEHQIYQKRLAKNQKFTKYILHDGPPYANGSIHIGHAMNKILKDIIVRYRNMNYFYAPFVPGWDTHGLPIEHAVMKQNHTKWSSLSVIARRNMCRDYAEQQIALQREQFEKLGLITDFSHCYYTYAPEFEIDQLKIFLTMVEKGLVYFSEKPVYWSWSSQTALAQAEVEYAEVNSNSIYVQLKAIDAPDLKLNANLIIWTTTPWTLPANRAVCVNPNARYVVVRHHQGNYIVAENLVENVCANLNWKNYQIVRRFVGSKLTKLKYRHPLYDDIYPVICGDYVGVDEGTGLVHNAPGFGLEDYLVCKNYNIPIFCPMDDRGRFTSELNDAQLTGIFYADANPLIIQRLTERKLLLKHTTIKHKVAHDWRTHQPVVFRATKQWFIDLTKIKENLLTNFAKLNFLCEKNRDQLLMMLTNRQEWCISRQRVWGVPIPVIFDGNHQPILDLELMRNIIQQLAKHGTNAWFEKPVEFFLTEKYRTIPNCYKNRDIFDVWFDSGISFNVFLKDEKIYPADLYLEGADQFRGWFNSSYICGCIKEGQPPFKALLATGLVVDENGNKMSKSVGNVVDPQVIGKKYGYDLVRLWVANGEYTNDVRIGDLIIQQNIEIYRRIRNSLFKFILGNLVDFDPEKNLVKTNELDLTEKLMLNTISDDLAQVDEYYQKYDFYALVKLINKQIIEYSGWYFEVIKDCLYCDEPNSKKRRGVQTVLYYLLTNYLIRLTPILPFTCEEAFGCLKINQKPESVHLLNWNDFAIERADVNSREIMDFFWKLRERVNQAIEIKRNEQKLGKTNQFLLKIYDQQFPNWCSEELLKMWFCVAKVELITSTNEQKILVEITNYAKCERCWRYFELENLQQHENTHLCERCMSVIKQLSSC